MFGDVGHAQTNAAMLLMMILQPQAALAQNPLLPAVLFSRKSFYFWSYSIALKVYFVQALVIVKYNFNL